MQDALAAIVQGAVSKADSIFESLIKEKEKTIQEAVELYKQKGVLWFSTDSDKAITAYKRATELDNTDGVAWNQLAQLYQRTGRIPDAMNAYQKVLSIALKDSDRGFEAITYGNIGIIHLIRGELGEALEFLHKSLTLFKYINATLQVELIQSWLDKLNNPDKPNN